jgi:release factor glutamine methyltransferase
MSEQEWTVGRLLGWTTDYLKQQGADNPRLDAEVLLAHARRCERIELYAAFGEVVDEQERGLFRELVKRRATGAPVAYLVGRKEFYSLMFQVTPDVLIPRPETEFLVVAALDWLKARDPALPPAHIVDVGTGSGCIAVSIAKHAANCELTAIDVSSAALAVARSNAETHGVASRIQFLQGDLLGGLPAAPAFDSIVSNPPYIGLCERDSLAPQVRDHEPAQALYGGETGIELTQRLVNEAGSRLRSGGLLLLETSPQLMVSVQQLFADAAVWQSPKVVKDLAGLARVCQAVRN